MTTQQEHFEELLREVFQFDSADLDFGIYRILNRKRSAVEGFISTRLPAIVDEAFAEYRTVEQSTARASVGEIATRIRETLGDTALDAHGALDSAFADLPIGREYAEARTLLSRAEVAGEVIDRVYNDLFVFFSRFYVDGDFIPKRRYGGKEPYAIPYRGEDVVLHWANADQYYIKTDELLSAYAFTVLDASVEFVVDVAEDDSAGDERRYFFVEAEHPIEWLEDARILRVRFRYRPLTAAERDELTAAQLRNPQQTLLVDALAVVIGLVPDPELGQALAHTDGAGDCLLAVHLRRFTRKSTADFFIHRDLRSFLLRELEFYLSNEVLILSEVLRQGLVPGVELQIERGHVVRRVAEEIVEFLAQIEDFQRRLFEKLKFVLRTEYVMSLGTLETLLGNDAEELISRVLAEIEGDPRCQRDLLMTLKEMYKRPGDGVQVARVQFNFDTRAAHLEYERQGAPYSSPALMADVPLRNLTIDSSLMSGPLKADLLHALSINGDLDEAITGLAMKSDGFQALALLTPKFAGSIDLAYIDPPFNTQGSGFLYKDDYRDSSWLSLMSDRLLFARELLTQAGSLYVHLDHNGNYLGRMLLNRIFGPQRLQREVVWNTNATHDPEAGLFSFKSFGTNWVRQHDTLFFYTRSDAAEFVKLWKPERSEWRDDELGWLDLLSVPKQRPPRRLDDFEFYIEKWEGKELRQLGVALPEGSKVYAVGDVWNDVFSFMQSELRTTESVGFSTQKPEHLLRRVIQSATHPGGLVLDFFAGSGTTLASAHMLGRRWIGVEMGDQFEEVLLPRMKAVLSGQKRTHLSRDVGWSGGGIFKYQMLEQYDDTLASLEFDEDGTGQTALARFGDDYVIRYMLDFETSESPPLVKQEAFADPWSYTLVVPSAG